MVAYLHARVTQARGWLRGWLLSLDEKVPAEVAGRGYLEGLTLAFFISRGVFYLLGGRFDTFALTNAMHLVDAPLLKSDFWRSVFYAHIHPPLFNVMSGVVLKLVPEKHADILCQPVFMLMGLSICLGLYLLMVGLKLPARLAATMTFIFTISPATLLMENWYGYSYPLTALILWSAVGLLWWGREGKMRWLFMALMCMALATGLHAFFQFSWFVLALAGLFVMAAGRRLEVLLCGVLPLAVAFSFPYKNYVLYGFFAASSWQPLTLDYMTNVFGISPEERAQMYASGEYSDLILSPEPIFPFERYPAHYRPTATGIPVLDTPYKTNGQINFNYAGYLNLMDGFAHDAKTTLRLHPHLYAETAEDALFLYLLPITDYFDLSSKSLLFYWDWAYNLVTSGRIGWSPSPVFHHLVIASSATWNVLPRGFFHAFTMVPWYLVGWFDFITIPGLHLAALLIAWQSWRRKEDFGTRIVLLYMLYMVGYVSAVSVFAAIGENHRYRYYVSPFLAVYTAFCGQWLWARYRRVLAPYADKALNVIDKKGNQNGKRRTTR